MKNNFINVIKSIIDKNVYSKEKTVEENKPLFEKIKNSKLKAELSVKNIEQFYDLLKIENDLL